MNQDNSIILGCLIGGIIALFLFVSLVYVDAIVENHNVQNTLSCSQLSEYYSDAHDSFTQELILEKCVLGDKPAPTCAEIDDTLTKHMRSEIELSNNGFKSFVDAMVWCKEKGYEVEPTLPLQSFGKGITE